MKKISALLLLLLCIQPSSFSQDQNLIDSLQLKLRKFQSEKKVTGKSGVTPDDTTQANILYAISLAYRGNDPEKSMHYAEQTLALSDQLAYQKGKGNAYTIMGIIKMDKGEFLVALELFKKSLKIRQEIGDKKGIAGSSGNIGVIYLNQGNYPEALKNYLACLKAMEEMGSKRGIAQAYQNIGLVYKERYDYETALKYYNQSLIIQNELGNINEMADILNNMGVIYDEQHKYKEALANYSASLKIHKEINNIKGIADCYTNIGVTYKNLDNLPESLKNHFSSLKLKGEIGDKSGTIDSYINIAEIYIKQKKGDVAAKYLYDALALSKEIGSLAASQDSYYYLAKLDSLQGNYKLAMEHFKLYYLKRDSLLNNANTEKIVQQQMQYDFDKKESLSRAEQVRKDGLAQKELQKQKLVRNGFVGGFTVVLLFAAVFFRQRNKISKEKKISEAERERSEELLLNILPSEVAEELKAKGSAAAKQFDMATVMFTDFKGFTQIAEKLSPTELVKEIDDCFKEYDRIITKHNIEKIKTIGDSYMCAGGLPIPNETHAEDVVKAALEIAEFMQQHLRQRTKENKVGFEIRIGIHTGPVVAGIVGLKKFAYDIWGDTVNIASRMESSGEAGKVNISGSTYALVKDHFNCTYRGKIEAKNKGTVDMYFVEAASPQV